MARIPEQGKLAALSHFAEVVGAIRKFAIFPLGGQRRAQLVVARRALARNNPEGNRLNH